MKERPILFSAPMVRAILDGRKTQTRRAFSNRMLTKQFGVDLELAAEKDPEAANHFCPYGQPGDRLWVRESWRIFNSADECACYDNCICSRTHGKPLYRATDDDGASKWKPSIHMPRGLSRITLEITDVRVERLNEISEADAMAEGIFFTDYGRNCYHGGRLSDVGSCPGSDETHPLRNGWSWKETTSSDQCVGSAKWAFANLWQSINGDGSWSSNPWVWVVEFKPLTTNSDL